MKPRNLTLQAFGPFAKTQCIHFDHLGDNPLFLINGDTGSGKSTILDAICFALYGQTTGNERSGADMRCDFASNDLLTEVTLDFSLGNKTYRIKRIPTQERAKKRAAKKTDADTGVQDETTTQNATASLWELGADPQDDSSNTLIVSSKVSEADREIKSLLGLDAEQFRQVMVLPQGKFRQLLLADSKDREKIFSQLFQTSIYKKIEEALKQKSSAIKKDVEEHQNKIKGILEGADLNTEDDVLTELESLQPVLKSSLAEKEQALKQLKIAENNEESANYLLKKFEASKQKNAELAKHKNKQSEINTYKEQIAKAQEAQKIEPKYAQQKHLANKLIALQQKRETSAEEVKRTQATLTHTQSALQSAIAAQKGSADLQKTYAELERYRGAASKLKHAQAELENAKKQALGSQNKLNEQQAELIKNKHNIAQQEQKVSELSKQTEQFADEQLQLEKSRQVLQQHQELQNISAGLASLKSQAEQAQNNLHARETAFMQQDTQTKQAELAWHNGQAALLAKELEADMPCPVCGSKQHPHIAQSENAEALISKQTLDQMREELAVLRDKRDQAKLAHEKLNNEMQAQAEAFDKQKARLGEHAQFSLEEVKNQHTLQEQKLATLLAVKEELKTVNAQLEVERSRVIQTEQSLSALQELANKAKEQSVSTQTIVQALEQDLPEDYRDTNYLNKKIAATSDAIEQLSQQLQQSQLNKDAAQSAFDTANSRSQSLATQVDELTAESQQASLAWQDALQESMFSNEQAFTCAQLTENQTRSIQAAIDDYESTLHSLTGAVKQLESELADKLPPNLAEIKLAKQNAAEAFSAKDSQWQALDARKNTLLKVQEKLKVAHKTNEALEKQYRVVGTLYEVSNGLTGDKVSLQRFVLSVLLDDVLIQASERLLLMSKGRYRLIRKEDKAKGNKASGLELEVEDAYTGKTRSVATLSGGESFIAALALALGLSDVVQAYSGGIKLDTLFIDEGFGSLDPESLELAIRTLIDLQTAGRTIGIISHVSELKSQMALRIDVKSGRGGSEIEMSGLSLV